MRVSEVRDLGRRRLALPPAFYVFALFLLPALSGCLPGFKSNDDVDSTSFSGEAAATSSAVNRSYKSNFLSLQSLSLSSGQRPQLAHLAPDSGSGFFSAFSTVAARQPAHPGSPGSFAAAPESTATFEPAVLPAAESLRRFYEALSALSSGRRREVTILHFGDDHIVDDRFAGELREHFSSRYGSAGRGLMTGLFPLRGMRVDRGGQWKLASSAAGAPGTYGITGVRISAKASDAWLRFTSAQGTFDWVEVTFATGPSQGSAIVSVDGDAKSVATASAISNQTTIRAAVKGRELVIRPRGDGEITVLSVATGTNTAGLRYANLGLPGATAATPGKWNAQFAAGDLQRLNPDLIILGFGSREGFQDNLDAAQYEIRLRLLIDQLRVWAPQASLLIIGPPDAARLPAFAGSAGAQACRSLNAQEIATYDRLLSRDDERIARWHAPPRLDTVRAALRRSAATGGAYFWDWAKFMGGACSIHAWTTAKPPLAAPDHITLTEAGAERSARALFTEIMTGFDAYQRALQAKAQAVVAQAASAAPARKARKKR
jgi:hypothetical protein